jgi:hypothetical protein
MIECGCLTYRIDLRKRSRELGSGSHHQRRGVDREIMIGDRRTTKFFELVKFLLASAETDLRLRWNKKVKICILASGCVNTGASTVLGFAWCTGLEGSLLEDFT